MVVLRFRGWDISALKGHPSIMSPVAIYIKTHTHTHTQERNSEKNTTLN